MTTVAFQYAADVGDWSAMQGIAEVPMASASASRRAQMFAMSAMYQRAFAAAVLGDTATTSKAAARFRATVDPVGPNVPASSAIRAREIEAMIATKRGDLERAIQLLREASAIEDKFLFVGPPTTLVAHELLGDALVAAKRPAGAEVAYEQELKLTPKGRFVGSRR